VTRASNVETKNANTGGHYTVVNTVDGMRLGGCDRPAVGFLPAWRKKRQARGITRDVGRVTIFQHARQSENP
jgi:hypothetical protein